MPITLWLCPPAFKRLACAGGSLALLLAAAMAGGAQAQDGVRLSALPSQEMARSLRAVPGSQGFNVANVQQWRATATTRNRYVQVTRRIAVPNPIVTAVTRQWTVGSAGHKAQILRDAGSQSVEAFEAAMPADLRERVRSVLAVSSSSHGVLWKLFFQGAYPLVRQHGDATTAYLFNPVYDGVIIVDMRRSAGRWTPASFAVATGERMRDTPAALRPIWQFRPDSPIQPQLVLAAAATHGSLGPVSDVSLIDSGVIAMRMMSIYSVLTAIAADPGEMNRLGRIVEALEIGSAQRLRQAGLDAGQTASIVQLPARLRRSVSLMGGARTADGVTVIASPRAHPGLAYLIGLPATGRDVTLTPVPLSIVIRR